jgi:alpha-ketoglutarate-dependent taurine dioxygenase
MATTRTLKTEKLTATVGAEVLEVDRDRLVDDPNLPGAVLDALEEHGVLVFRGLDVDDEAQAAFCRRLGEVRLWPGNPVPEIFEVSWNPENPYAEYLRGTVDWHIDGTIDQTAPVMATVLSAKVVAPQGGETEFANAYAAYDDLTGEEKERFESLRVMHTFVASQRSTHPDPTPEQLADWEARGGKEQPLVWTHRSGRRSLVLGGTADHVVGLDVDAGRELLDDLLERATTPERVYRHSWSVGDTVIWDNRGLFHRVTPFDPASRRELHRTTILGDEAIQ